MKQLSRSFMEEHQLNKNLMPYMKQRRSPRPDHACPIPIWSALIGLNRAESPSARGEQCFMSSLG